MMVPSRKGANPRRLPAAHRLVDEAGHRGGAVGDVDAGGFEGGDLFGRGAGAAGDDRAGVAHPLAGRRGLAGDEADDRLGDVSP